MYYNYTPVLPSCIQSFLLLFFFIIVQFLFPLLSSSSCLDNKRGNGRFSCATRLTDSSDNQGESYRPILGRDRRLRLDERGLLSYPPPSLFPAEEEEGLFVLPKGTMYRNRWSINRAFVKSNGPLFLPFFSDRVFHFDKSFWKKRGGSFRPFLRGSLRRVFARSMSKIVHKGGMNFFSLLIDPHPGFPRFCFNSSRWNIRAGEDRSSSLLVHCISVQEKLERC